MQGIRKEEWVVIVFLVGEIEGCVNGDEGLCDCECSAESLYGNTECLCELVFRGRCLSLVVAVFQKSAVFSLEFVERIRDFETASGGCAERLSDVGCDPVGGVGAEAMA